MTNKAKTKFLAIRVTPDDHKVFSRMAGKFGRPSDILRELVEAFITNRLTIKPPSVNRKLKGFFHE